MFLMRFNRSSSLGDEEHMTSEIGSIIMEKSDEGKYNAPLDINVMNRSEIAIEAETVSMPGEIFEQEDSTTHLYQKTENEIKDSQATSVASVNEQSEGSTIELVTQPTAQNIFAESVQTHENRPKEMKNKEFNSNASFSQNVQVELSTVQNAHDAPGNTAVGSNVNVENGAQTPDLYPTQTPSQNIITEVPQTQVSDSTDFPTRGYNAASQSSRMKAHAPNENMKVEVNAISTNQTYQGINTVITNMTQQQVAQNPEVHQIQEPSQNIVSESIQTQVSNPTKTINQGYNAETLISGMKPHTSTENIQVEIDTLPNTPLNPSNYNVDASFKQEHNDQNLGLKPIQVPLANYSSKSVQTQVNYPTEKHEGVYNAETFISGMKEHTPKQNIQVEINTIPNPQTPPAINSVDTTIKRGPGVKSPELYPVPETQGTFLSNRILLEKKSIELH